MKRKLYTCLLSLLAAGAFCAQVPDNSFGKKGKVVLPISPGNPFSRTKSGLVQPDGKIIVSGYDYDENFLSPEMKVWRLPLLSEVFRTEAQRTFATSLPLS